MITVKVLLIQLLDIYIVIIIIRAVISWFVAASYYRHPLVLFVERITDPVMRPVQRVVPPIGGTLDISPILVLFGIGLLKRLIFFVL